MEKLVPLKTPYELEMAGAMADKVNQHTAQLHQLQHLMNLTRVNKQNRLNRRLVRKQQDGTIGSETQEPEDTEDDYIQFGNNVYNLGGGTIPESAAPAPSQPREQPRNAAPAERPASPVDTATRPESKPARLWPWVLAAALSGTGLGMGAMALPTLLNPPRETIVPELGKDYMLDFRNDTAGQ